MKPNNNYHLCKTIDPLTTTTGFKDTYILFLFKKNYIMYNYIGKKQYLYKN
jgi:hypothetical protein